MRLNSIELALTRPHRGDYALYSRPQTSRARSVADHVCWGYTISIFSAANIPA